MTVFAWIKNARRLYRVATSRSEPVGLPDNEEEEQA